MRNKYNAVKKEIDGFKFDSTKESKRYLELKAKRDAGEIKLLNIHPTLTVIPDFEIDGKKFRKVTYTPDFTYFEGENYIIEDVKGYKTEAYMLRKKIVCYMTGIAIRET